MAQYIKFEMPVLQSFITKLKEEEDREVQKLRRRYHKHFLQMTQFSYFFATVGLKTPPQKNPLVADQGVCSLAGGTALNASSLMLICIFFFC